MIRRRLVLWRLLFSFFSFLSSRRRLISVNQDLDFKTDKKPGLAIQTSFAACPPKQIIPRKAREAAFPHYI